MCIYYVLYLNVPIVSIGSILCIIPQVMSCPDVPIERINNVNKSCKVIEGIPPYC